MKLDGYEVLKGDKLFDIDLRGVVTCQVVNQDAVVCQAIVNGRRVTLTYNAAGNKVGQPHRVLYWQNPLVLKPPKSAVNWSAQAQVIRSTLRAMETYAQSLNPTEFDTDAGDPEITSIMTAGERGLINEQDIQALLHELKNRTD